MNRSTYTDWNTFREAIVQDILEYLDAQGKSFGYWVSMPQFARDAVREKRLRNVPYDLSQCKPCGDLWMCVHQTLYAKNPQELVYVGKHPDPLHYSHDTTPDPRNLLRGIIQSLKG